RIDSGIERGSEVGIYYDPLLAKLIAHADSREAAVRKLAYGLRSLSIEGLRTNRGLLIKLLEHPDFRAGIAHTGLIAEHFDALISDDDEQLNNSALIAAALYWQGRWQVRAGLLEELPPSYRNSPYRDPSMRLEVAGKEVSISWHQIADTSYEIEIE